MTVTKRALAMMTSPIVQSTAPMRRRLRKKLGSGIIETVRGLGYRMDGAA